MDKGMRFNVMALALSMMLSMAGLPNGSVLAGDSGPVARLRPCAAPPVIDGVIGEDEWNDALVMQGSTRHIGNIMDERRAWAYVTFDRENLYLAVRSETQPGNLLRAWPMRPGVADWTQDASELWVAPLPSPGAAPIDRFQIWLNPHDGLWGMVHRYGVGFTFKGEIEYANALKDDHWTLEAAIPWRELGVEPADVKDGMHFLIRPTRNWAWNQYTSWGYAGAFAEPASMLRIIVDENAPVILADHLGDFAYGDLDMRLTIRNPGKAEADYLVGLGLYETPPREERTLLAEENATVSVGPGGTKIVSLEKEFDFGDAERGRRPSHLLTAEVKRVSDDAICYKRNIGVAPPREKVWPDITPRPVALLGGYYPYFGKVRAEIDRGDLPGSGDVTRAVVRVMPEDGDTVLGQGEITRFEYNRGETIIEVGDLPEGKYRMAAEVYAGDTKLEHEPARSFERLALPWERNTIGISDRVYPPFTPLEVEGATVSCVLREHTVNGAGLWDQVLSMDTPVLAGPMRLEGLSQGESLAWTMPEAPRFREMAGHRVVHEGSIESAALAVRSVCTWDYDGMMKVEMDLEPRGTGEVDELALVIPFRPEEALLYHATTFIRANPNQAIPDGEGVVWDSRGMVQTVGLGSFVPYIWVGGPERGISWSADNDRGWIADDEEAAFQIVRTGDEVQLRVRLINTPARVRDSRRIVFGVQASPAKPQPEGFRGWGGGPGSTRNVGYALGSWLFQGLSNCESLDPINGDWSIVEKMAEFQQDGKVDWDWVNEWLKKHGVEGNTNMRGMLPGLMSRTLAGWVVIYTNPYLEGGNTPQMRTFGHEWKGGGRASLHTPSFVDYAVWCFDKMLSTGLRAGIYQDNTFPVASLDLISGNAYVRDDGMVQAGWDMWGHRDMYRRMFVSAWERTGEMPLIAVHLTNSNNISYFSFTTIGFDLEWEYGTDRTFQEKFGFDHLQVTATGKQAGLKPIVLCAIRMGGGPLSRAAPDDPPEARAKKAAFQRLLQRSADGVQLLHDIQVYGRHAGAGILRPALAAVDFTGPETVFIPYWRNDHLVAADREKVQVSLYALGEHGVLAVVCSVSETGSHRVRVDLAGLGFSGAMEAVDLELDWSNRDPARRRARQAAGEPEDVDPASSFSVVAPGELEVPLEKHDFRLILFRPRNIE